jgi:hypothetical protein
MVRTMTMGRALATMMLGWLVYSGAGGLVHGQGNLVRNGGFEGEVSDGETAWGWTYNMGVEMGWPGAAEGGNNAIVHGTLFQDVPTEPGQRYRLAFAMAGNFNIPHRAMLNVHWGEEILGPFTWSPGGRDMNDMGWIPIDLEVIAVETPTRLRFENPFVGTPNVIRLDAVEVTWIPEPSVAVLLALGGLGLLAGKIQRRVRPWAG